MSYAREPEESLGATPGITSTNPYKTINSSMIAKPVLTGQVAPVTAGAGGGSAIGMGLLVVGLGLGGFLLYRHFKKKQATGSDPAT